MLPPYRNQSTDLYSKVWTKEVFYYVWWTSYSELLLQIHGQLIAGIRLPRILNYYSKLSITDAGNLALNVPNITSACYLIQVCLWAEFRAMILSLENEEAILGFEKCMNEKHMNRQSVITGRWYLIFRYYYFSLFVQRDVLNSSMKYIFALNHCNYACWFSLHVDDSLNLEYTCPCI